MIIKATRYENQKTRCISRMVLVTGAPVNTTFPFYPPVSLEEY
jgi:hypothetical protein